jgi:hypothetical protein
MYMSDLRHIHDPVLSSLKMEGIRFLIIMLEEIALGRENCDRVRTEIIVHHLWKVTL